jgi:tetratricopeptide (TPR) repeat protein
MEELVKMLIEDRVVQKLDEERWTVETSRLESLRVPPTLVGLLQARFDSLLYPEKLTLQRAAVVGRVFYDSAIVALNAADETHVDDMRVILKRLIKREFIFDRETSAFEGSTEYIFGQAMMRSLILDTLLERQAKTFHRATAEWFAAHSGERSAEYDGLIAEHYEQAGEYFLAAEFLSRASQAAFNLGAYKDGIRAGDRSLELLETSDPQPEIVQLRLETQMSLADVHGILGHFDATQTLLESALDGARSSGDRVTEANALAHLGRLEGAWLNDYEAGKKYLEQALEINQDLGDKPTQIFILRQLGNLNFYGDLKKGTEYLEQSLNLARELGDLESSANALNSLGLNVWSLGELERSLVYFQEGHEVAGQIGDITASAMTAGNMAWVQVEMENYPEALKLAEEALAEASEAGAQGLMESNWAIQGWVALANGHYELARDYLLKALNYGREFGSSHDLANRVFIFAWHEAKTGDVNKALEWVGLCMAHAIYKQPGLKRFVDMALDEARIGVSDEDVKAALARGAELDLDEVVEEILGEETTAEH